MPSLLAETSVASWRPTLRYHQRRLDVLTTLESEGLLKQFRVTGDMVGARTDDAQLTMNDSSVTVHSRGNVLTSDVSHLIALALASAAPPEYKLSLASQFLAPIPDVSYDEARVAALNRMSHGFFDALGASDFALLLDGTWDTVGWHCEFGIVSQDEIGPRLSREVGQLSGHMLSPPWAAGDIPHNVPVGFFADFIWHAPERETPADASSTDELTSQLETLRVEAASIVSSIWSRLCEGSLQAMAGGAEP